VQLRSYLRSEALNPNRTLRAGRVDSAFFLDVHHAEEGGGECLPPPVLHLPPLRVNRHWTAVIPTKSQRSGVVVPSLVIRSC